METKNFCSFAETNKQTYKQSYKKLLKNKKAMMKSEHFRQALQIISQSNSIKVSFNVPVKDNYSSVHEILIHESNASVINELIAAGFSLSMCNKGLTVKKY